MNDQTWWNKNAEAMYGTFKEWVGDENAMTKKYAVQYFHEKKYKSVVDLGCADATLFFLYKKLILLLNI